MVPLILLLTFAVGAQAPASTTVPTIADVAWLAGCWEMTRGGRHVAEHWMPAEGGTMMGVSRTTGGGKTIEWEFLIIRQGVQGLEYVAKPARQAETTFVASRASAHEVTFENPAHDFPKRITYKREGDALTASIEGPRNGQSRRIEFPYKKSACGGG